MLWQRQAIIESKGDKLSSYADAYISLSNTLGFKIQYDANTKQKFKINRSSLSDTNKC